MAYIKHRVVKPPAAEPILLGDVRTHLRLIPGDMEEDDAILTPLIPAAREFCENTTGRALAPQTIAAWPDAGAGSIRLPRPPLIALEGVNIFYADGTGESLAPSSVLLDEVDGILTLPAINAPLRSVNPIEIRYRAGYEKLPFTLRQALLLLIGHWYENRSTVEVGAIASIEVTMTLQTLLNQYKVWWF